MNEPTTPEPPASDNTAKAVEQARAAVNPDLDDSVLDDSSYFLKYSTTRYPVIDADSTIGDDSFDL